MDTCVKKQILRNLGRFSSPDSPLSSIVSQTYTWPRVSRWIYDCGPWLVHSKVKQSLCSGKNVSKVWNKLESESVWRGYSKKPLKRVADLPVARLDAELNSEQDALFAITQSRPPTSFICCFINLYMYTASQSRFYVVDQQIDTNNTIIETRGISECLMNGTMAACDHAHIRCSDW